LLTDILYLTNLAEVWLAKFDGVFDHVVPNQKMGNLLTVAVLFFTGILYLANLTEVWLAKFDGVFDHVVPNQKTGNLLTVAVLFFTGISYLANLTEVWLAKFNGVFDHVVPNQKTGNLITVVVLFFTIQCCPKCMFLHCTCFILLWFVIFVLFFSGLGKKWPRDRADMPPHSGPMQGECLFVCSKYKEMYGNIEET